MNAVERIKEKAKANPRRVVLPEGTEPRVILATKTLREEKLADVTLLGDEATIRTLASDNNVKLDDVEIIDPAKSPQFDSYVDELVELRKAKGLERDKAVTMMTNPLYFGAMLVRHDKADAAVAGSINTTGDVLRSAIHCLGLAKGISTVSSSFIMTLPKFRDEENKILMFGDCAVIPDPDASQLASIAMSTADTMTRLIGGEPRIAMLSFSTKGSAKHETIDKVLEAVELVTKTRPELKVDGELQLDAAIIPEIGSRKAPDSEIAGQANVLIFPDLGAGNIGYKLVERLAGATATGPIIQGLAKPANDLSRGCSAQDIVDVSAIATLLRG